MRKDTLIAIGGGGLSAVASIATVYGPPVALVLAYLAPLPLLAVGLSLGTGAALVAAAAGVATVAMIGGLGPAGIYGGMHALPCWLLIRQALTHSNDPKTAASDWYPVGLLLGWLAVLAVVFGAVMALAIRGDDGIEASVRDFLNEAVANAPHTSAMRWDLVIKSLTPLFVGMSGAAWQVMIIVNAVIAQGVLARQKWNLRPTPQWSAFTLPDWLSWLLVAAAIAALIADGDLGYLARNMVLVLATPFFFLGLAVVHSVAHTTAYTKPILFLFYLFLMLFLGFAAAAVAGLGMIEQWAGVRRRFVGAGPWTKE